MEERTFPAFYTERLHLRKFSITDSPEVQRMAGDYEVAYNTLNMPHPYLDGVAEEWIASLDSDFHMGKNIVYAICLRGTGQLIGALGLTMQRKYRLGEMGYWLGKEHWNNGYCTEAAKAVINYAFNDLNLHKIYANHFNTNPASGRVMVKAGMHYEGTLKSHLWHFDIYKDLVYYGIINPSHL